MEKIHLADVRPEGTNEDMFAVILKDNDRVGTVQGVAIVHGADEARALALRLRALDKYLGQFVIAVRAVVMPDDLVDEVAQWTNAATKFGASDDDQHTEFRRLRTRLMTAKDDDPQG